MLDISSEAECVVIMIMMTETMILMLVLVVVVRLAVEIIVAVIIPESHFLTKFFCFCYLMTGQIGKCTYYFITFILENDLSLVYPFQLSLVLPFPHSSIGEKCKV